MVKDTRILKQLQSYKLNSKTGWKIYFGGELLVMKSGKFVWEKESHAKNALIRSLKDSLYDLIKSQDDNIELHHTLETLINLGTIQFKHYDKL